MKNYLVLFCTICLAFNVSAQKKESRKLSDFNEIKVSGGISVELFEGNPLAKIEVSKGELDELVTEVKGDVLHIKFSKKGIFNWNSGNRKAYIKLYGNLNLESINASAGSYIGTENVVVSNSMDINVSSGAQIDIEIEAVKAKCKTSSGGNVILKGISNSLNVDASSGGSFNGKKLESENVKVNASSGGNASVWASDSINANASSGGSVKYKGSPKHKELKSGKYSGGSIREL